ncbi:hypothetical protein [Paraburkholderia sp. BCC1886]|uniref:hypothetical protein n=1 Tax=Paraburkholderia sp. BCC1886 TaxID=2562670 RepID=UPI001182C60D|nr:hypothetical protein [Paraburkholderia sp. BCC1886]
MKTVLAVLGAWVLISIMVAALYVKIKTSWRRRDRKDTPLGVDDSDLRELLGKAIDAAKQATSPADPVVGVPRELT